MLEDFQNCFVRLATDETFRAALFQDPELALRGHGLSERERRALTGIPVEAVERYAQALLAKREREFAREVPLSLQVCPSLPERYRRWLARHPAPRRDRVLAPGLAEAERALTALRAALEEDPVEAPYAGDLLAFEVLAKASRFDGEHRTLTVRYRTDDIARDLRQGLLPMDPDPVPTRFAFHRGGFEWQRAGSQEAGR